VIHVEEKKMTMIANYKRDGRPKLGEHLQQNIDVYWL
jgi:hypothetical protein